MAVTFPFHRLLDLEKTFSLALHARFGPIVPRSLLHALEVVGDDLFWFTTTFLLLVVSFATRSHFTPFLLAFLAGSILDLFLVSLIKHLVRRPRPLPPPTTILAADVWSFPSAHASRGFFAATFVHLCGAGRVAAFVFVWSGTTSASRVMLGRHFVLDVVGGALIGVVEGWFVFQVLVLAMTYVRQHGWV